MARILGSLSSWKCRREKRGSPGAVVLARSRERRGVLARSRERREGASAPGVALVC
jgi:hypothetical protein